MNRINTLTFTGIVLAGLVVGICSPPVFAQQSAAAQPTAMTAVTEEVASEAQPDDQLATTNGRVNVALEDKDRSFTASRTVSKMRSLTNAERKAAAQRNAAMRKKLGLPALTPNLVAPGNIITHSNGTGSNNCGATPMGTPCGSVDYFGTIPNYALSKYPPANTTSVQAGVGIRKFVDTLAGLGPANKNNLNKFIPVAVPFATKPAWAGDAPSTATDDYYEIGLYDYTHQFNSDLPTTTQVRGYADLNPAASTAGGAYASDNASHYLGPLILATANRPVRVKFTNHLDPTSKLFIPIDITGMGAGMEEVGTLGSTTKYPYSQNRANLHLHGGNTPWISDGTPHQWTVPVGDTTSHSKKGVSVVDVPDMTASGDGSLTYYWTNQQSSRLMFYHDHSYGITRLNVYAGEAAGYLIHDAAEEDLIAGTNASGVQPPTWGTGFKSVLPNNAGVDQTSGATGGGLYRYGIPLILQDKTFVPPVAALTAQDPTWNWGAEGNLWFPHVYMTNQSPSNPDDSGANAMGRWDLGAWFWPPMTTNTVAHLPVVCGTNGTIQSVLYQSGSLCPPTPNPSLVPESFMDTPIVNGTAYPTVTLPQGVFRFRILNAANDRFFNLSLFYAADKDGNVCKPGYPNPNNLQTTNTLPGSFSSCTEVKMVDAVPHKVAVTNANDHLAACSSPNTTNGGAGAAGTNGCWPSTWPTDGRDGGVPDPSTAGPAFIQIGTEGGVLPAPVVIDPTPVGFNYNRRDVVVLNIENKSLFVGPAERADVIVDLSHVPSGATLMLYNDSPAPVPGFDTRLDTYTGDPDQTDTGGAPTTLPGYGPNIRTVMQIHVTGGSTTAYNLSDLQTALPYMFQKTQPAIIVPQTTYNSVALNGALPSKNTYTRVSSTSITFTPTGTSSPVTYQLGAKAIHELFENDYGKMNSILGVELPLTNYNNQTTIPLAYVDPPTEFLKDGETQFWKITHNGVDSHAIHFHLMNVQVINRMGWDGAIRPPDANELGWKETVRMNPLEDVTIAFKPMKMTLPAGDTFPIGNSTRLLDPTRPAGAYNAAGAPGFTNIDPLTNNGITTYNVSTNFGWEYVWHCHLLGHEESDMMRPMVFDVNGPANPGALIAAAISGGIQLNWATYAQGTGTQATNISVQRAPAGGSFTDLAGATALPITQTSYQDLTTAAQTGSWSYRLVAYNGSTLSGPSNTATVTRLATPSGLAASNTTAGFISLTWNAPVPATGVTGYQILRSSTSGGTYVAVGTSATRSFRQTTIAAGVSNPQSLPVVGQTYYYKVVATGTGGQSSAPTAAVSVVAR